MTRLAAARPLRNMPARVRNYLDSWKFWFTMGLLGLIAAGLLGYHALQRANGEKASRQFAAYAACVASIPELEKISQHIRGVNEWLGPRGVLVKNARALVRAAPPSQRAVRRANLAREIAPARDVAAARNLPVPTLDQCLAASKHPPAPPPASAR